MREFVALLIIYMIFLAYSIVLYRKLFSFKKGKVYLLIPLYLLSIYLYFEFINYILIRLRENKISFDFGHANIMLILLLSAAYLTAVFFIVIYFFKRKKSNL